MQSPHASHNLGEGFDWLVGASAEEMRRIVDALYRVHDVISAVTDLDVLLERIMEQGKIVAEAEACSLMLYDEDRDELYFQVALAEDGDMQALKQEVRLKLDQGIAGSVATSRQALRVADASEDPRFYADADRTSHFETRSLLAVPLLDRGNLVGVIEVLNKVGGGPFTDRDERVLEMFATWVATALTNARLIEENMKRERLAAIGQAVAGLSHYTKNILAGMSASVELIGDFLGEGNHKAVEKSWPVVERSTRRMSMLVEDMLAFSTPRKPLLELCTLDELLEEVTSTFSALMTRKKVELNVDTEGMGGKSVKVDSRGLFRCILNLLTNAADAVPEEHGKINVRARLDGAGQLEITVEDNGPGIPDDVAEQIFEPFFSTKGSRGTGLGLPVTRKVIEEHGGTISVGKSELGGAQFKMALPAHLEKNGSGDDEKILE